MAMLEYLIFLGLGIFVSYAKAEGEYCVTGQYAWSIEYCENGCCGDFGNYYCCPALATWIIVLIVIGCIIFMSAVTAVICYFVQTGKRTGRVVATSATVTQPVCTITHTQGHVQQPYGGQSQPFGVSQPPPYGGQPSPYPSDAAYPPPAPAQYT